MSDSYADRAVEKFKRAELQRLLALCDEKERDFFYTIFPNEIPSAKLRDCIDLAHRTLSGKVRP